MASHPVLFQQRFQIPWLRAFRDTAPPPPSGYPVSAFRKGVLGGVVLMGMTQICRKMVTTGVHAPKHGGKDVQWPDHIEVNPSILRGKPVVRGTRVPVHLVVGNLAGGATIEEVMEAYAL